MSMLARRLGRTFVQVKQFAEVAHCLHKHLLAKVLEVADDYGDVVVLAQTAEQMQIFWGYNPRKEKRF